MSTNGQETKSLEPPAPPELWDLYEILPWEPDGRRDRRIIRDIVAFELVGTIWFFTKLDRSVTSVDLGAGIYQVRPA